MKRIGLVSFVVLTLTGLVAFRAPISGHSYQEGKPVYVTNIDPDTNTVMLGDEEDLDKNEMTVGKLNMIKYETITPGMEAITKIRYKDKGTLSNIYPEGPTMKVHFYENAKGIAPGQSAVFYEGDDVLGGGIIQSGILSREF